MHSETCPECTRKEFDLNPEAVTTLVDQIPVSPGLKADDEVMAQRLSVCLTCDASREKVLCAYCGCFIHFRIRLAKAYCPHPAGDRWFSFKTTSSQDTIVES